jgi:hypothetical protein
MLTDLFLIVFSPLRSSWLNKFCHGKLSNNSNNFITQLSQTLK